ncbi:hypothetical protein NQ318_018031 [Aromia moschata]|uniref:Peptidase aspartic putative domain-containing protein n=1 Tax=Aromia moschata TaxID=1265417 RepID=A0AAV8ZD29_9CUCU|nr:hypothetical protein NQ318_018031 [Aromia moschata]
MNFYDTFNGLIHTNSSLFNVHKLYYLQSCLKGEASQVIKNLEISDSNYTITWELLKERFENKRLIVNKHIQEILEVAVLKQESHVGLKRFLDTILKKYALIENKLDLDTKNEWEQESCGKEFPTLENFTHFLTKRCQLLEKIESNTKPQRVVIKRENERGSNVLAHVTTQNVTCTFCNANHFNHQCNEMKKLSSIEVTPTQVTTHSMQQKQSQIILSTTVIYILDHRKHPVKCRALLDSGSQSNFMTTDLFKRLNLTSTQIYIPISDISAMQNVTLADPHLNEPGPIDVLLGVDIFWELICIGQINNGKGNPILQKTRLAGSFTASNSAKNSVCNLSIDACPNDNQILHEQLEHFWKVEEFEINKNYSKEENECEQDFLRNFKRDQSGRFEV